MQVSQEQNFGDEGGKRVVIGTGCIQGNGRGVTDWLGMLGVRLDRRSKLNGQADYCLKKQGKYILKKTPMTSGECKTIILRNHHSVKHQKYVK